MKPLSLVLLAGLAAAASAETLPKAFVRAQKLNGHNATNFTLRINQACDAGPFVVPTWCADSAEGVLGGAERVLEAPAGRRVRFFLYNDRGPWDQPVTTTRLLAIVPADAELTTGGCPEKALACTQVPLGGEQVLWIGLEVGTYKYYDPSWPGSGYGLLKIVPDHPAGE